MAEQAEPESQAGDDGQEVGEAGSDDEGQTPPPTYEQLEAALAEVAQRALDYQFLIDVPNNRVVIQRTAGPTVYQESWDPVFARKFVESLESMLGKLKGERSQFVAQMRKLAEDEAPGGPKLWTPQDQIATPPPGVGPMVPNRATRRANARS